MKRGIIFDMDGTLWDSAENVAKSWNVAIRQYGVREKELISSLRNSPKKNGDCS